MASIIGFAGRSGAGKTSLPTKLILFRKARGYRVFPSSTRAPAE